MPRTISSNYKPGDVLPDGSIVVGRRSCITQGIVYVSAVQARKALEYGWYLMDEEENEEGLLRVSRREGWHHPYPFSKGMPGKKRRQQRRHRRRERLGTIDDAHFDESDN